VAVLAGDGEEIEFGGWTFATTKRVPLKRSERSGRYAVGTILSPRDEAIDLTPEQIARALNWSNKKRTNDGRIAVKFPDGPEIRMVRSDDRRRGLLLLYPLSPRHAKLLDVSVPIFGVVLSFPDSDPRRAVRYRFNTVEQRMERI